MRKTQQHNRTAGRLDFCVVVVPSAGQQVEQEQREEENCSCGTTMFGSLFVIASLCMAGQLWSGGVRWGHTAPPRGVQLTRDGSSFVQEPHFFLKLRGKDRRRQLDGSGLSGRAGGEPDVSKGQKYTNLNKLINE